MFIKTIKTIRVIDIESLIWLTAFLYLALINPYEPKHFTLCLFRLVGIENCPGCGLGKSISMIFHGDFVGSLKSHPLGIPALILIVGRIYKLIRNTTKKRSLKKMEVIGG